MSLLETTYCVAHRAAKKALGKSIEPSISFGYVYNKDDVRTALSEGFTGELYYGENENLSFCSKPISKIKSASFSSARDAWSSLVEGSVVPLGWKNSGFCNVCYSKKVGQWCLSSWIWTSAAIARYAVSVGEIEFATGIVNSFLDAQQTCGGWVVRNDYTGNKPAPMLAPNDSSYIANNALLSVYKATGDNRYLEGAKRCADWVIDTALESGLVSTGYNTAAGKWVNDAIIVDTGFTAALFATLCELGCDSKYGVFLDEFVSAYIDYFRDSSNGGFATSVSLDGKRNPGKFARGQAWALEGLIPAYKISGSELVKEAIDGISSYLVENQASDGGWAYNLAKPLMGQDCKGVPVIARSLAEWGIETKDERLMQSAAKALRWCEERTDLRGECPGGIFSYCMEGAVTHYLYSEAAFVYSSSYALEALALLDDFYGEADNDD